MKETYRIRSERINEKTNRDCFKGGFKTDAESDRINLEFDNHQKVFERNPNIYLIESII